MTSYFVPFHNDFTLVRVLKCPLVSRLTRVDEASPATGWGMDPAVDEGKLLARSKATPDDVRLLEDTTLLLTERGNKTQKEKETEEPEGGSMFLGLRVSGRDVEHTM